MYFQDDEDYKWIKADYETMGWDKSRLDYWDIYYCEECMLMHSYVKRCPKE